MKPRTCIKQVPTCPKIYTLHPTPYTLHPTPYTLHLTPCIQMFDFETTLSGIEYKIRKLVDENNGLRAEIARLTESNEELGETIKNQEKTINKQKEETNILKLRNTLVQKGDSAEIKLKINQLIRNIDKSLSLLTQIND